MPGIPNRGARSFSKYDAMEDEALRDFLRLDASKPEAEAVDTEELLYVMGVLAKRRKERGEAKDAKKAFEEFKKYYDPRSEAAQEPEASAEVLELPSKRKPAPRWKRKLVVAAAVAVLLVGCTLSVGAAKFDLWELFVKFTRETLYIDADNGGNQARTVDTVKQYPYSDFPEALRQHSMNGVIIPTWLPEGFSFSDRHINETPLKRTFHERYVNGDKSLTIEVAENRSDSSIYFQQLDSEVEVYQKNDYIFYILRNDTQYQATCIDNTIQCTFYGDLTYDEVIQMIESIKKV